MRVYIVQGEGMPRIAVSLGINAKWPAFYTFDGRRGCVGKSGKGNVWYIIGRVFLCKWRVLM